MRKQQLNLKIGERFKQTLKEEIQMANETWKDAQQYWLLEKWKLKPQWATTTHLL